MHIDDIQLDPKIIQTSPAGKQFRVATVGFDLSKPPRWVGREEKRHKYVEVIIEEKQRIRFEFDYYDTLIKKQRI